jgi:hypothetical protein
MNAATKTLKITAQKYMKALRREARQQELVAYGKTLVPAFVSTNPESESSTVYVEPTVPRGPRGYGATVASSLSFLAGKTAIQSRGGRKNRPGEGLLHAAAIIEDAALQAAKDAALPGDVDAGRGAAIEEMN